MATSTMGRRAVLIGTLAGLSVMLLGGLSAASRLANQHWASGNSAWSSAQTHGGQGAWGTSVKISGNTRRLLGPGVSSRINLRFANHGPKAVRLRHVRVTITGITAPQADAAYPCTRADFQVRPMRARPFVLPGDGVTNLVRLGVPAWQWPHLTMRNRPVNQDGCKDASLTLSYLGYRAWSG